MKTSKEDLPRILEMRAQNKSVKEIAQETGWAEGTIYAVLKPIEGNKSPRFPKEQYQDVVNLFNKGYNCTAIGQHFNISHKTVSRILKLHGIQVPTSLDQSKYAREHWEEIIVLWDKGGITIENIAKQYKTSVPTIGSILNEHGYKNRQRHRGPKNPAWRGGRRTGSEGYVYIWADPNHPFYEMATGRGRGRNKAGVFLEHRIIMAEHLGRPLESWETVHHKNGIRDDNRIENLELRQGAHGAGQKWCCADCGSHNIVSMSLD